MKIIQGEAKTLKGIDQNVISFPFVYNNHRGIPTTAEGYVFHDDRDDVYFIMKCPTVMKGKYSEKDFEEQRRLRSIEPLVDGDFVLFDNRMFKVQILGNYSDAGRLIPVEN